MPRLKTKIKSDIVKLTSEAFGGFCEDVSALFNIDMACTHKDVHKTKLGHLRNHFSGIFGINNVTATGTIKDNLFLLFDKEGIFTLPGIISMRPESQILESIKKSSDKQAKELLQAFDENVNIFASSWDRVFREHVEGHDRLVFSHSFIGTPWDSPEESFGMSEDEEIIFISFEMTIGSYSSFQCGVLFPASVADLFADTRKKRQAGEKGVRRHAKHGSRHKESMTDNSQDQSSQVFTGCAKSIMQKKVIWISQDDTVETAISKMKEHDVGYLMVGTGDDEEQQETILEGIVSRSDIAGAVSPYLRSTFAKWRRPIDDASLQIRIKWIMSRPVRTVKLDTSVTVIMENMSRYGGRCLPVLDEQSNVVGLVTVFEVFNSLLTNNGVSLVGTAGQPPLFV